MNIGSVRGPVWTSSTQIHVAFGYATSLFLAITFASCVGFHLAFPQMAMYRNWQALLPGFTGISWSSFLLGLVESYGYGW